MALSADDRAAAFRLRYDVYIAEQGKPYPEADHVERLLIDELDAEGEVIIASDNDESVVGTVRANWFDSAATGARYWDVLEMGRFAAVPLARMAVCSRLAASTEHRHSSARAFLLEAVYERGLERNTLLCFATCSSLVLRVFRKYGSREYAPPIQDPVVGRLHRTVLVLDDLEHLSRVGSPLLRIAHSRGIGRPIDPSLLAILESYEAPSAVT